MMIANIFCLGFFIAVVNSLELAEPCDAAKCLLPNCKCSTTDSGSGLPVEEIPQMVLLTFDDAVTTQAYAYFEEALFTPKNPDGCPIGATHFICHEYTDYTKVHELWKHGHEVALHSLTHTTNQDYWKNINLQTQKDEFGDLRTILEYFGGIPEEDMHGIRTPFLQVGGNATVQGIQELGLKYDSSMPTQNYINPGLWPYTFDFASTQECNVPPCPTASFPGIWEVPMIAWQDQAGYFCSQVDGCIFVPTTADEIFAWIVGLFENHYKGTRAPFPVFMHAAWFMRSEENFKAYKSFIEYLGTLPDVYIVNLNQAIEWIKNPKPVSEGKPFGECLTKTVSEDSCVSLTCELKTSTGESRWMTSCVKQCPANYPWLGNPYGL